jgi:hypothetical protein
MFRSKCSQQFRKICFLTVDKHTVFPKEVNKFLPDYMMSLPEDSILQRFYESILQIILCLVAIINL